MDPNETLRLIREQLAIINATNDRYEPSAITAGLELAELVEALDAWIVKGGFLPADWQVPLQPHLSKVRIDEFVQPTPYVANLELEDTR